jgi:putative Holliday junction resolvase
LNNITSKCARKVLVRPIEDISILLAFDYGKRRLGIAVGQMVTGTATPLTTLQRRAERTDWSAIAALVQAWKPDAMVVGLPHGIHDDTREVKAAIAAFRRQLEERFELPVYTADEAYTSTEAYARLKERRRAQNDGKRIQKDEIDCLAAAILLEAWMSAHRTGIERSHK